MTTPFLRRRQLSRLRAADAAATRAAPGPRVMEWRDIVSAAEVERAIEATEVLPDVPKGHCPKCGEHIGKGLHFHRRACRGAA